MGVMKYEQASSEANVIPAGLIFQRIKQENDNKKVLNML